VTRKTNSRVAGFTFLAYIALGIPALILSGRQPGGRRRRTTHELAQHVGDMRLANLLDLLSCFAALTLAVTLYAITRDEDPDISMLGLTCRVGEGLVGANVRLEVAELGLARDVGNP